MKRILTWLKSKFSLRSATVEADGRRASAEVSSEDNAKEGNDAEIASDGDRDPTQPKLTTLDVSSYEVTESTSFDPYDSGSFEKSDELKSRTRK